MVSLCPERLPHVLTLVVLTATSTFASREALCEVVRPVPVSAETVVRDEVKQIREDLAPLIRSAQEKYRVPGIGLALVRGQETLWSEGFGFADMAGQIPATPDTIFRTGSLAKPFTALAVMQLAEAGELDIDQPLIGYLPEFSIRSRFDTTAEPITVRSILCHHSGLPTDLNKGMWSTEPYTEVAARLEEEYTAFPPNLVFSYSNVGYTLLGHLVEKVGGVSYADFLESRVFQPLGMGKSSMGPPRDRDRLVSKGYRNGNEVELLPIRDLPAYGLYTSAADLGSLMRALLDGTSRNRPQLLKPETFEEMFEPQNTDVELDLNIVNGLGWFLEDGTIPGGGRVVRHGGTTLAFSGEVIMLPEKGLGIAVLANSDGSRSIVSRLAEEILARVLDAIPRPLSAGLFMDELEKEMKDPEPVDMEGNYATDFGLISIRPKSAKLCACIVGETVDLIPYPNGWFGVGRDAMASLPSSLRPLTRMRFQTQEIDGKEVIVAEKGDKKIILGEKVPPTAVSEKWLKRVGEYELLNPDEKFPLTEPRLKVRDGQLCMSYKMPLLSPKTIQVPLRPISDTEAIILGLGRTRGETLRAVTVDGEERLRYSGFVGRKLENGDQDQGDQEAQVAADGG
ncbi:MAG: serine hydrolase domain-containing protein [Pseudomonadota bacterium]|nr:serine hydrolase domain-containing protein [Pseudomonadota bacterium]